MSSDFRQTINGRIHERLKEPLGLHDRDRVDNLFGLLFLLPGLVFLVVLALIPAVYTFYLSVHDVGLLSYEYDYVGLDNYVQLYSNPDFFASFWRGVYFAVASVLLQLGLGLALALMLNRSFRGGSVARTLTIFPYLVPTIGVAVMWKWLLNPVYGVVNNYLVSSGLIDSPIAFFGSTEWAMEVLVVANSWKFASFAVLIFLARLQSIDQRMYEQAKVSGASTIQMFKDITLPHLRSAILLVLLLRGIWMFNKFDIIWLLTSGGPLDATTTLPVFIYEIAFFDFDLALGSAAVIQLFVLLSVVSAIYFWAFKPSEEVETGR